MANIENGIIVRCWINLLKWLNDLESHWIAHKTVEPIYKNGETYSKLNCKRHCQNVLRNGRFNSYLSLRGAAWLPDRIQRGTTKNDVCSWFVVEVYVFPMI
ncbi:hypothetical protein YC2023_022765 [Brassica napus]